MPNDEVELALLASDRFIELVRHRILDPADKRQVARQPGTEAGAREVDEDDQTDDVANAEDDEGARFADGVFRRAAREEADVSARALQVERVREKAQPVAEAIGDQVLQRGLLRRVKRARRSA